MSNLAIHAVHAAPSPTPAGAVFPGHWAAAALE